MKGAVKIQKTRKKKKKEAGNSIAFKHTNTIIKGQQWLSSEPLSNRYLLSEKIYIRGKKKSFLIQGIEPD